MLDIIANGLILWIGLSIVVAGFWYLIVILPGDPPEKLDGLSDVVVTPNLPSAADVIEARTKELMK
jgi:hypothetical protein